MKIVVNNTGRELVNHALGTLEPGDNEISEERETKFKERTGLELEDLEGPYIEVKTKKAKKKEDDS